MTKADITIGLPKEWDIFQQKNPEFMKKLDALYETLHKAFIREFTNSNPADRVIFFLGRLCVEDFNEVLLLCGNGCGIGGLKILRGLYERAVTLGYIAKYPDKAKEFLDYDNVHRGKWLNHLKEIFNIKKFFSEQEISKTEEKYRNTKEKYQEPVCKKCGTYRTRFSWSNLDILSMARESGEGLEKLYLQCYYEPTLQAHATVSSFVSRLKTKDLKHISFHEGAQHEKARQALIGAHNVILYVLDVENKYFNIDIAEDIQQRFNEFEEIWKK